MSNAPADNSIAINRIWYRRLTALLLSCVMLILIPVNTASAASAQSDSRQKVKAGDIMVGTATLYGQDGVSLEMGFAYSSGCVLNDAAINAINSSLAYFNTSLNDIEMNTESITKQRFFAVGIADAQKANLVALKGQLDALAQQGQFTEQNASGTDVTETSQSTETTEPTTAPTEPAPALASGSDTVSPSGNSASLLPLFGGTVSPSNAEPQPGTYNGGAADNGGAMDASQETPQEPAQNDAGGTITAETEQDTDESAFTTADTVTYTNSLAQHFFPNDSLKIVASLPVYGTIERSFRYAFPEFNFAEITYTAIPRELLESGEVSASDDMTSCTITFSPAPVTITHSVFGEQVTSVMVAPLPYEYNLKFAWAVGTLDGVIAPPPTTTTTTTTTVETTETTAAPTTASTTVVTLPTYETVSTTTETTTTTTTTTTAATTTEPLIITTTASTTYADLTAPTTVYTGSGRSAFVNTRRKRLRLRVGPGTNYRIITHMPKGTHITVLNTNNESWYYVRMDDGTEGYCYSYYVKFY